MNIYDWLKAQIDIIKNCAGNLDEARDKPDIAIIQLWALKRHIDAMIDYMERHKKYEP